MKKDKQTVTTPASPEEVLPYDQNEDKELQITKMFNSLAARYDQLNRVMALGLDKKWRRLSIERLRKFRPKKILDVAAGTGDMAILVCQQLRPKSVVCADISQDMIDIGKVKVQHAGLEKKISFEIADCLHLPYPNGEFDAVTVAFGIRNFANIAQGLQEIHRVLKPGGGVVVTELSTPTQSPFKQLATIYTQVMVRFAGWWLRLDFAACKYLPASIKVMPQGEKMAQLLQSNGFGNVTVDTFTWGVCSCYAGVKIENNDHTGNRVGADAPAKKKKVNKANRPSQNQSL